MDQKRRRIMLFGTIVLLGTMLTVLEIDPLLLVGATIGMGIVLLVAAGGVRFPLRAAAAPEERNVPKKEQAPLPPRKDATQKKSLFAGFHLPAFHHMFARLRPGKKKEAKEKLESIDALLDQALAEKPAVPPAIRTPVSSGSSPAGSSPSQGPASMDPFMALSTASLQENLEEEMDLGVPGDTTALPSVAAGSTRPAMTEPDEVADILKDHVGELSDPATIASTDALTADLDSLKDVDLGSLELEAEQGAAAATAAEGSPPVAVGAPDISPPVPALPRTPPVLAPLAAAAEPAKKAETGDPFASGNRAHDDILSALKTDMKKVKIGKDPSLVRDMKDMTVQATDLEKDLAEILDILK
ncbi:MAG: hypothetical protein LUQ13_00030 [Methanomicrobiales archaeon]|nr:hypothetical protein [Methanomicrobiales archaeon]